jgi:hypothetical protein
MWVAARGYLSSWAVRAICRIAGLTSWLACASRRRACQSNERGKGTVAWWQVRQSGSIGVCPFDELDRNEDRDGEGEFGERLIDEPAERARMKCEHGSDLHLVGLFGSHPV